MRKPLAIASALALSAGVALTFSPTAGAAAATLSCTNDNIAKLSRATGGQISVGEKDGTCFVYHS